MTRAPPRLPVPCLPHRTLRTPSPVPDNVASLGIPSDEINEGFPLVIPPNIVSLPQEALRLGDGNGGGPHLRSVRHWRTISRKRVNGRRTSYPRNATAHPLVELNKSGVAASLNSRSAGPSLFTLL